MRQAPTTFDLLHIQLVEEPVTELVIDIDQYYRTVKCLALNI